MKRDIIKKVIAMYTRFDAMINLVGQNEEASYCYILNLDPKRKEACVRIGQNHHLRHKDAVIIESYDDMKGLLFYQGIVSRTTSDEAFVYKLHLVDEKQRRLDVRVNVSIPLFLKGISRGRTVKKLNRNVLMETVNISAGGMLLKTKLYIEEENACLIYDFPLDTKSIGCKAQIVRKQIEADSFLYGCKLLTDENDRAELRKYVYKTQIKTKRINFNLE